MPEQVCMGATLKCSFGATSKLVVLPTNRVLTSNKPAATILDPVPMLNIMPFGACKSLANPQVAAATSAAMGVLTPQPCIPVTTSPWTKGAEKVLIANIPALDTPSKLMCQWAGVIEIQDAGQTSHQIP